MDPPFGLDADDALAQPTRARLFRLLGELKRPAGTAELAQRVGLHPNGVRVHLERLAAAGLVERRRAAHGRGRPRDAWTIAAGAHPGGRAPRSYDELARWLARSIPASAARLRAVEATGREIGREIAPRDGAGGQPALEATLVSLGFAPRCEQAGGGRLTYCLGNCPFRDAVRENQQVVCTLHRGLTRGLLDALDPHARLAGFVARDPDRAGCLIELAGVSESSG